MYTINKISRIFGQSKPDGQQSKAQGLVEFALVLPVLLLLILGIIEFGRLMLIYSMVTSASREAVRYGAAAGDIGGGTLRYEDCAGIREAATRIGGIVGVTDADIDISYDDGSTVYSASCPPSSQVSLADRIIVTVRGHFQSVVPLVNIPSIPIVSTTTRTILKDIGIEGTPAPTDIPPETEVPVLEVVKVANHYDDVDGDGFISPGDILEYVITINNTSVYDAGDLGLEDPPDANTTLIVGSVSSSVGTIQEGNTAGDTSVLISDGTLAGGSSATVSFRVEINSPFPSGINSVSNQASVSATSIDIVLSNEAVTTVIAGPNFTAEKSDSLQNDADGSGSLSPGDTLRYTVVISNDGNADATNVIYADTPDTNTALVVGSVNVSDGTVNQGNGAGDTTVEVDLGTMLVNDTVTITYDVTIDDPFPEGVAGVYNQGVVSCDEISDTLTDDPATGDEDDTTFAGVTNTKSMEITKADSLFVDIGGDGNVSPGDTLKYVIVIENTGVGDITGIVFSDSPGSYTALVAGSVTTDKGSDASSGGNVQVDVGTLNAGQQATITFQVIVDNFLPEGVTQVSNQGEVSNNELPNQNTDDPDTPAGGDATVTTVGATIVLEMEATKEDLVSGDVYPGDTIEYRVVIENTGTGDITGIVFDDSPGSYLALVPGSVTTDKGSDASSGTDVQVNVGTLIPGEQATITFTVDVASLIPGTVTEVSNQGDISSTDLPTFQTDDPDVGGSSDPTTTTITSLPVCAVTISLFNDITEYKRTWEIENTGNVDLRLFQLGVQWPDGSSDFGDLWSVAFEDPIWTGSQGSSLDILEAMWNAGVATDRDLNVGVSKLLALTFAKQGVGENADWLDVYFYDADTGVLCSIVESW